MSQELRSEERKNYLKRSISIQVARLKVKYFRSKSYRFYFSLSNQFISTFVLTLLIWRKIILCNAYNINKSIIAV